MSAGVVPSNEYLISTTVLTQNEPSVTFDVSSFAGVYKHLQVVCSVRDQRAVDINNIFFRFNGDNGANYSYHLLAGQGSSVFSENGVTQDFAVAGTSIGASGVANVFAGSILDILDAFSTTKNKTTRSLTGINSTASQIRIWSGNWRNLSPISSINLFPSTSAGFVAGSRFSLYGVTA
jgi:hypothetical protein